MADIEKVIKGIESCKHGKCDYRCPYASVNVGCRYELMGDALELLKEQREQIIRLQYIIEQKEAEITILSDQLYRAEAKNPVIVCPYCGKRVK